MGASTMLWTVLRRIRGRVSSEEDTTSERRRDLRLEAPATVCLERMPEGAGAPVMVLCRILDYSANGLRLRTDEAVGAGTIVRLGARLDVNHDPFRLVGEVRWCRAAEGSHDIGLILYEAADTDIVAWKRAVADRLA